MEHPSAYERWKKLLLSLSPLFPTAPILHAEVWLLWQPQTRQHGELSRQHGQTIHAGAAHNNLGEELALEGICSLGG
jgi:hypothetical protein